MKHQTATPQVISTFLGPAGQAGARLANWSAWLGRLQGLGLGAMLVGFAFGTLLRYWRRLGAQAGIALDAPGDQRHGS